MPDDVPGAARPLISFAMTLSTHGDRRGDLK